MPTALRGHVGLAHASMPTQSRGHGTHCYLSIEMLTSPLWRIVTTLEQRITPANPPHASRPADNRAVFLDGENEVLTTPRLEPTHWRQPRANHVLIPPHRSDEECGEHDRRASPEPMHIAAFSSTTAERHTNRKSHPNSPRGCLRPVPEQQSFGRTDRGGGMAK